MAVTRAFHGWYWVLPFAAFIFWTATLLGLLLWWAVTDNAIQYKVDESTVVFISDVGAAHKALFIPGTALTWIFFSLSLIAERWLRHLRRIPGALKKRERNIDIAAVVFGVCGGACLFLLSVFNAFEYSTAHWILTAAFVILVAICAILQTLEVMSIERDHPGRKHLRRNAIAKISIVSLAVAIAIVFAACYAVCSSGTDTEPLSSSCNRTTSAAGVAEWFVSFIFDAYLLTLCLDLWPARKTSGHKFHPALIEADRANVLHEHKDGRIGARGGVFDASGAVQTPERAARGSQDTARTFAETERSGTHNKEMNAMRQV